MKKCLALERRHAVLLSAWVRHFEGVLTFEGVIRLDGKFTGEIRSEGTLIVGETARLDAEIEVDTVVVSG